MFSGKINYRRILAATWPLAGGALVSYGAWLIYPPAGLITVGSLMILDTLHASRSRGKAK